MNGKKKVEEKVLQNIASRFLFFREGWQGHKRTWGTVGECRFSIRPTTVRAAFRHRIERIKETDD